MFLLLKQKAEKGQLHLTSYFALQLCEMQNKREKNFFYLGAHLHL